MNKSFSKDIVLLGTVGRISYQKNPYFILKLIEKLRKHGVLFKFLWIGHGEDEKRIKEKAQAMGISDVIIFYGVTDNIPAILSAIDVFILPSLFEGLSIVLIEAQASGLPVIVSNTLTAEACISDKYYSIQLNDLDAWCKCICDIIKLPSNDRAYPYSLIQQRKFSVEENIERFETVYVKLTAGKQ